MHPVLVDVDAAQGNLAYMSPREQGPKTPIPVTKDIHLAKII